MAIVFESASEYVTRTATLPGKSPFSMCGWVKISATPSDWGALFYQSPDNRYTGIFLDSAAQVIAEANTDGPTVNAESGVNLTSNTWYFVGLTWNNSSGGIDVYVGAYNASDLSTATNTNTGAQAAADYIWAGAGPPGCTVTLCGWRIWEAELTPTEMEAEFDADKTNTGYVAQKSGVWGQWKMLTVATAGDDTSGNSRSLTTGGTLSEVAGPFDGAVTRNPVPMGFVVG